MNTRTTTRLLLLVCLLGAFIWCMRGREPLFHSPRHAKLVSMPGGAVSWFTVSQGDLRAECRVLQEEWSMVKPLRARADTGEINRMLSVLESLRKEEVITQRQRQRRGLTLDDYGVGRKPRGRFLFGDGETISELLVGRDAPLEGLVYVRLASDNDIAATSSNVLALLPRSVDSLRDRAMLRGDPARAVRIEISQQQAGFIKMVKQNDRWLMQQPVKNTRAGGRKVLNLLKRLHGLRAERFVADADVERCGLGEDQAAAKVSVWMDGDTVGQKLLLGKPAGEEGDGIFAKCADSEAICVVKQDILQALQVRPVELRDRLLFGFSLSDVAFIRLCEGERRLDFAKKAGEGWFIVQPRQSKADDGIVTEFVTRAVSLEAAEFIDGVETNLTAFGLRAPKRYIELRTVVPEQAAPGPATRGDEGKADATLRAAEAGKDEGIKKLLVGNESQEGGGAEGSIFVRFEDEPTVMRLAAGPMKVILEGKYSRVTELFQGPGTGSVTGGPPESLSRWINPLLYSDSMMLRIDPATVVSISLEKAGKEQTILRDPSGAWMPLAPSKGKANQDVAKEVVAIVSNLRAKRLEYHEPSALASYGLDETGVKLTFGLGGGKAIRKTIVMGFLTTDGVYAMVHGQDVVFVLPKEVVGRLMRDLVAGGSHAE